MCLSGCDEIFIDVFFDLCAFEELNLVQIIDFGEKFQGDAVEDLVERFFASDEEEVGEKDADFESVFMEYVEE